MNTAGNTATYEPEYATDPALPAWKQELNAKLAAHRQRRPSSALAEANGPADAQGAMPPRRGDGSARAASVAARVAERYAKAPSYSDFLAASAAAASAAAETAAFAARQAQEAAEAFARLSAQHHASPGAEDTDSSSFDRAASTPAQAGVPGPHQQQRATIEHPDPLPPRGIIPPRLAAPSFGGGIVDAFAEAMVSPAISLPAKLIEFPRELIAARKSRPRIAEGPLVEEAESPQLRIFEVGDVDGMAAADGDSCGAAASEAHEQPSNHEAWGYSTAQADGFSTTAQARPAHARPNQARADAEARSLEDLGAPDWQSIRLGEHPAQERLIANQAASEAQAGSHKAGWTDEARQQGLPALHAASLADRAMAALVDAVVVGAAFLLFVLVFAACTTHPPVNKVALIAGAAILGALFLFYEWLFMSYGGGTLGMRYAQIALCTFEDDNPARTLRRRRVAASVLAALPLGLGFLWALFDEDGLGWHDRMSRSYQRSYR